MKQLILTTLFCCIFSCINLFTQEIPFNHQSGDNDLMGLTSACPAEPCPCKGGIVELQVYYFGADNVDINVYSDQGLTNLITSFANVVSGQLLVISAGGLPNGKFATFTYFQVNSGGEICVTEIFSTCPFPVWPGSEEDLESLGKTIGDFVVFSRQDFTNNQICTIDDTDQDWHVGGNVVGMSNNTLGTRNNEDVVLISNDLPRGVITSSGRFGLANTTPNAILDVTGDAIINETLDVNGIARVNDLSPSTDPANGALIVAGGAGIGQNLNVSNDAGIGNDLDVGNNANVGADLLVGNNADIMVDLSVGNNGDINNDLDVGNDLRVFGNGFVNGTLGIGINSPARKLHVRGDGARISTGLSPHYLEFLTNGPGLDIHSVGNDMYMRSLSGEHIFMNNDISDGKVAIGTTNVPNSVGGTDISSYKLYVSGGILTEEVRVRLGWADYVFEKDYALKSLDEVETFIQLNGHLPGMPSANEVENNGLELGDISKKQQEKIEELFLYMIEMKKELNALKAENSALKAKLDTSSRK